MSLDQPRSSSRLSPDLLSQDQQTAVTQLYEGNKLVVAKMGAGKTIIAASAIAELLDDKELDRILIVTTPKIANTVWCQEFDKWEHTYHIDIAAATGAPEQRKDIIESKAQVVVVTFNVLPWMKTEKLLTHFDGLLIDETTKLKSSGGAQFKALRRYLKHFDWRAGLTGTPVSEDFIGLYAQMMLIDNGESLGTNKEKYLNKYFYPTDFNQYNWELHDGADKTILDKIRNNVHVMPDYRDTLPPIEYKTIPLTAPPELLAYYKQMKKDMITEDAVSQTSAVLVQKLQQIACGFIYTHEGYTKRISDYRIDALKDLIQSINDNVIVCYWYQEDLARLKEEIPHAVALDKTKLQKQVELWNAGAIPCLLIHPRSAGHGLQLEKGGHTIIWYSPQWSNDLWEQTNARVWRQGQKHSVTIYTLSTQGTIDQEIQKRVDNKAWYDNSFNETLGSK